MESNKEYWALKYFIKPSQKKDTKNDIKDSKEQYEQILRNTQVIENEKISDKNIEEYSIEKIDKKCKISDKKLRSLFKLCEEGDYEQVSKILFNVDNIQDILLQVDQFGWTLLMCACTSGSVELIELLIKFGALSTLESQDIAGNTALSIAKMFKFQNIVDLLQKSNINNNTNLLIENNIDLNINVNNNEITVDDKNCDDFNYDSNKEKFLCEICDCFYEDKIFHEQSIAHLFNIGSKERSGSNPISCPNYSISKSNRGYQIMKASGWDESFGLGSMKQGRIYPIRSQQKLDRLGLGVKKPKKEKKKKKKKEKVRKKNLHVEDFRRSFRE